MDKPALNLKTPYTTPPAALSIPFVDLSTGLSAAATADPILTLATRVTDGTHTATLSTLIRSISDGKLALSADAQVSDGTQTAPFDFKYDDESGKFGAGTAFLED